MLPDTELSQSVLENSQDKAAPPCTRRVSAQSKDSLHLLALNSRISPTWTWKALGRSVYLILKGKKGNLNVILRSPSTTFSGLYSTACSLFQAHCKSCCWSWATRLSAATYQQLALHVGMPANCWPGAQSQRCSGWAHFRQSI